MADYLTKDEYEKDAYEKRHNFVNNIFQPIINNIDDKMDENQKAIIELKTDSTYMKKQLDNIDSTLKNLPEQLEKLFVTKIELKELEKTIDKNKEKVNNHDRWIFSVV